MTDISPDRDHDAWAQFLISTIGGFDVDRVKHHAMSRFRARDGYVSPTTSIAGSILQARDHLHNEKQR
jgi:hypothetical protein